MVVLAVSYQIALSTARKSTADDLPGTYPTPVFWALFTDAWAFLSICIPKLGVALLLSRMLRPKRWLKITMITYCIVLVILAIVGFIITFTQCSPVAGQWNPWKYPKTKCWNRNIQLEYAVTVSGKRPEVFSALGNMQTNGFRNTSNVCADRSCLFHLPWSCDLEFEYGDMEKSQRSGTDESWVYVSCQVCLLLDLPRDRI